MTEVDAVVWRRAGADDAEVIGRFNAQLSVDEGAEPVGPPELYVQRMRGWLEQNRYEAALAYAGESVVAYVVWRDDPDYDSLFVRQFFVARPFRGKGLGRALFLRAVDEFWPDRQLRLDVYDTNPRGAAFWTSVGFVPYSRLMRRPPSR